MRVSFNWLKDYVDIRTAPEAVAEKLTMAGLEVTSLTRLDQDTILEIEVTPNRTDCLSVIGIAREVAAITAKKLKIPKILSFRGTFGTVIPIQIQDKKLCLRYLGRVIKNVKVGPSPEWLIRRLEVMGVRAVNNIVDITNFCLLEFGQPMHAFDLDKLQGQKIIIRRALKGEQIVTIDGVKRVLDKNMLVIADRIYPQAIAGIMGARDSEVGEGTKNILLESAYFDPLHIHNTSRKLGLATQSSYRFERGVDLEGVYQACSRATELIQKLAYPGRSGRKTKRIIIGRLINKGTKRSLPNRVRLRFAKVGMSLGVEISPVQIKDFLRRLQFTIVRSSKEGLAVEVPSFRQDISREADLIEEIVRLYGYDKIPLNAFQLTPNISFAGGGQLLSEQTYSVVRQILSSLGFNEIMTYSLVSRQLLHKLELSSENVIAVKNPLSYEQEILRPTLLGGMLNSLLSNMNRKNLNLKLFELSRIYLKENPRDESSASKGSSPGKTKELTNLCIGLTGSAGDNWLRKQGEYSFFDLKGAIETMLQKLGVENFRFSEERFPVFTSGRCAAIMIGEETYAVLGEIKKEVLKKFDITSAVFAAEIQLHKLLPHICQEKKFVPLARFPAVERDISLIASHELHAEQIVSLVKRIGGEQVRKVTLFDQYVGEQIPQGYRGLTYAVEYRSPERTLTAEEVDKLHAQVRQALAEELKVQLR